MISALSRAERGNPINTTLNALAIVLLVSFSFPAAAQKTPKKKQSCWAKALTQSAMNECAAQDLATAEQEQADVISQIRKKFAEDKVFLEKLDAAQCAWFKFRDAQMEMEYPKHYSDIYVEYGSVHRMCVPKYKEELTRQRTKDLRKWLVGVPEGEVCRGSENGPTAPTNKK